MIKVYMLVTADEYSLPIDISLTIKGLAYKYHCPCQTLYNALNTGRVIRYLNARIEAVYLP